MVRRAVDLNDDAVVVEDEDGLVKEVEYAAFVDAEMGRVAVEEVGAVEHKDAYAETVVLDVKAKAVKMINGLRDREYEQKHYVKNGAAPVSLGQPAAHYYDYGAYRDVNKVHKAKAYIIEESKRHAAVISDKNIRCRRYQDENRCDGRDAESGVICPPGDCLFYAVKVYGVKKEGDRYKLNGDMFYKEYLIGNGGAGRKMIKQLQALPY
jgi:hypothetical protein